MPAPRVQIEPLRARAAIDPDETREWLEAITSVPGFEGDERAEFLLDRVLAEAQRLGVPVPYSATTRYVNTIPASREIEHPGDREIEHRIRSAIRWNALAMMLRANTHSTG